MKAILTKFHGAGNVRGSRISATDEDGNRVIISADDSTTRDGKFQKAAIALCKKMGWTGRLIGGGIKGGNVYVFDPAVPHGAPLTIED